MKDHLKQETDANALEHTQIVPRQTKQMNPQSLEVTQIMPRIDVEDLEKRRTPEDQSGPLLFSKTSAKKKKIALILGGGFVLALLIGFAVAKYYGDQREIAEHERIHQKQVLQQKQQDVQSLEQKQLDLERQKAQLEQERNQIEQKQKDATEKARVLAENEQALENQKNGSSGVTKLWNTITGKDKQQASAREKASAAAQAAVEQANDIKTSLDQAQSMIERVDGTLEDTKTMTSQAKQLKDSAQAAYAEHSDVIDKVIAVAEDGKNYVDSLIDKYKPMLQK